MDNQGSRFDNCFEEEEDKTRDRDALLALSAREPCQMPGR